MDRFGLSEAPPSVPTCCLVYIVAQHLCRSRVLFGRELDVGVAGALVRRVAGVEQPQSVAQERLAAGAVHFKRRAQLEGARQGQPDQGHRCPLHPLFTYRSSRVIYLPILRLYLGLFIHSPNYTHCLSSAERQAGKSDSASALVCPPVARQHARDEQTSEPRRSTSRAGPSSIGRQHDTSRPTNQSDGRRASARLSGAAAPKFDGGTGESKEKEQQEDLSESQ